MILNLGQIASTASTLAGGRADWALSEASLYVNAAVDYIWNNAGLAHTSALSTYEFSSGTSGGYRIPYPSDYASIVAVSLGSRVGGVTYWTPLTRQDPGWQTVFAENEAGGKPEAYVEYTDRLELVPYPNSTYTVRKHYLRDAPSVVLIADTISWDHQWNWAVVLKTSELLAASRADFEMEALARNRYLDYVSTLMPEQDRRTLDTRSSFQPSLGTR